MKAKAFYFLSITTIFALLLSSCSTASATNTPIPPISTITPLPTPTSTQTIKPASTPIPEPWYGIPITTANANQVEQLAIWGKGLPWTWRHTYWPSWNSNNNYSALGLGNLWIPWATDFAAEGNVFVVQTPRGIYLYLNQTGALIAEIESAITYRISDDGRFIVTGHNDGSVRVWNALDGSLMKKFQYSLSFKKDLLSVGGSLIPTVGSVAISRDNQMIAGGFADDYIVVWKSSIPSRPLFKLYTNPRPNWWGGIRALAFSPDNKYLVGRTNGGSLLWQMDNGNVKLEFPGGGWETPRPSFSPDGNEIALYSSGRLDVFDIRDGKLITRVNTNSDVIFSFSPDWQKLYVDYYYPPEKTRREIRSMPNGKLIKTVPIPVETLPISFLDIGHLWRLSGAKVLSDKSILAWGSTNDLIYWWNFSENKLVSYPIEREKTFFSSYGKFGAICEKGEIVIFTSGGINKKILVQGHQTCDGIVFSPDQDTLAVWTKNRLALVSMSTSDIQNIMGHQKPIIGAAFSNDGTLLASAEKTYPGQIFIWKTKPVTKYLQITSNDDFYWQGGIPSYYVLAFSPDDNVLATRGFGNPVRLWNVSDGSQIETVNVDAEVIAFSPDENILATANRVGIVSLWQITNGKKLAELRGHAHLFERNVGVNDLPTLSFPPDGLDTLSVKYERDQNAFPIPNLSFAALSFLTDGTGILSVGADGTIRLWSINPNSL